jgi:hypothetical protein
MSLTDIYTLSNGAEIWLFKPTVKPMEKNPNWTSAFIDANRNHVAWGKHVSRESFLSGVIDKATVVRHQDMETRTTWS